jgi:hypothetical protein
MGYKYNPFSGRLTPFTTLDNPIQFRGTISVAADFPTSAAVQTGWLYFIQATVTDNDPTKTNTGLSFVDGDEIAWDGSTWELLGNSVNLWQRVGSQLSPLSSGDTVLADGGLTIGIGAAGVDYTLSFNGESNDGILTFDEDLKRFVFDSTGVFADGSHTTYLSDGAYGLNTDGPILVGGAADIQGDYLALGNNAAGVDYYIEFKGETNTGRLTWMEDENRLDLDKNLGVTGSGYFDALLSAREGTGQMAFETI